MMRTGPSISTAISAAAVAFIVATSSSQLPHLATSAAAAIEVVGCVPERDGECSAPAAIDEGINGGNGTATAIDDNDEEEEYDEEEEDEEDDEEYEYEYEEDDEEYEEGEETEAGFEPYLLRSILPGEVDVLRWESDGIPVQDHIDDEGRNIYGYAARVGVPPTLVPAIQAYAQEIGLWDVMTNMLYDDPLGTEGARAFSFPAKGGANTDTDSDTNRVSWAAERPGNYGASSSDMHWFDPLDEYTHEEALRTLANGGFDQVLEGVGEFYGLDQLHVDSVGFLAVTQCEHGYIHMDFSGSEGRAFNFLLNLHSPAEAGPHLTVENGKDEHRRRGVIKYQPEYGMLMGDYARHGTRECDHRQNRGVRITATIFLADANERSMAVLDNHDTSYFPPGGESTDYIWANRGRHWHRNGGRSLQNDLGRRPLDVEDYVDDCAERVGANRENCLILKDSNVRDLCLKTCEIFLHDDIYKPGEERSEVWHL